MKPLAGICLIWGLYGVGQVLPWETYQGFEYFSIVICLYSASPTGSL